ncbi:MAG: tetratricopeptide repeat protein [Planctomycetota bacterium]|nr:MAG: tetratricopeptide repeat protein [Planctomycetota bacterium]
MARVTKKRYVFLTYVVLGFGTIAAFERVRLNDFIYYDDDRYVTDNPQVKAGITRESIHWALTTTDIGYWHPLAMLSHMLDCELFGLNPYWHHLTSLFIHVANTLLLFWVFKRMTGAVWASSFVAAVFAVHPLHVESVAWISERKDVLSGLFWMLTMAAYVWYVERTSVVRYLLVVLGLSAGLMAKPMVVTLPFVLLLLDYWPLRRFQKSTRYYLICEKIPLFILTIGSSVVTYLAQQSAGATEMIGNLALSTRTNNALVCYVGYIKKMIYPSGLAILYPHPGDSLPVWKIIVCLFALFFVSAGVIYWGRQRRYLAVGWLWYLGTLVPVIGLVQVGVQAMADRYTYLSAIGIFIMITWGSAELASKWRYRRLVLPIVAGLLLAMMLVFTRIQVRRWQNNFTLFEHTLALTKNNYLIHNNYGGALLEKGRVEEAIRQFEKTLRINPGYTQGYNNIGVAFFKQGRRELAIAHWAKALELEGNCVDALNNLGWALATTEDTNFDNSTRAVKFAEKACGLTKYNRPSYLDTLAAAYAAAGRFDRAIETAKKAIKLAEATGKKDLAREIRKRLQLYQADQPYRQK